MNPPRGYWFDWMLLEAKRMPIDRLETALERIAGDDSDAAARTRAALVDQLDRRRQLERDE